MASKLSSSTLSLFPISTMPCIATTVNRRDRWKDRLYRRDEHCRLLHQRFTQNRQMARYTHAYRRGRRTLSARHLPDYVEPGDRTTHRRSGILPQPAPISGQHSRRDFNSGPHPARNTPFHQPCLRRFNRSRPKNIQIVNPYFVPTKSIRKAIKKALKKGTEVEIMIPAVSDIPFTPEASFYIAHKLMKRGAKVYLFKDGFHHSK